MPALVDEAHPQNCIDAQALVAVDEEHGDVDADLAAMEEQAIAELEADLAELHDEEVLEGAVHPVLPLPVGPLDLDDEEDFDDDGSDGWSDDEDFNEDMDELEDAVADLHQNLIDLQVMTEAPEKKQ